MITAFCTSFPDWLLVICLLVMLCAALLFVLKWLLIILSLLFFVVKYAVTGRWKEFNDRIVNDPDFLTFDKETGKFIS